MEASKLTPMKVEDGWVVADESGKGISDVVRTKKLATKLVRTLSDTDETASDSKVAAQAVDRKPAKKKAARLSDKVRDRILELRREGLGVTTIARRLEDDGVKTPTGKKKWHGPAIRNILVRELGDGWAASKAAVASTRQEKLEDEEVSEPTE